MRSVNLTYVHKILIIRWKRIYLVTADFKIKDNFKDTNTNFFYICL